MSSTLVRQLVQKNYRHCFQQLSRTSSTTHLFSSSTNTNTLRLFQQQQWRLQSSTVTEQQEQTESSTTTTETSEEEKKPFVFPIDEERINRMLLPHEEAKKALEILISTLNSEPYIQKANEIAAMSNETQLFPKFQKYLRFMMDARTAVANQLPAVANSGKDEIQKTEAIRTIIGKFSLMDPGMLKDLSQLYSQLAKQIFNVDLPEKPVIPDRVAINIFLEAHKTGNRRVYEEHMQEALSTPRDQHREFLEKYHVPLVFEAEMDMLKEQEKLLAVSKKKKVLYDRYMEMMKEDANSVTNEQWEERAAITFESLTPEDERFELATPAGWIALKFQLSDCLYRLG